MKYDKQIENISNLGKQKRFSKKFELKQEDYESLTQYAKKGIVEKTKDYFHAIKLAPQKVTNFFKSLFDKEKQDESERQRIEQEKIQAKEKERLEKQKLKNSPEYKKRRADRDAR